MKSLIKCLGACAAIGFALTASADKTFTVDPAAGWVGFMNVFDLPSAGGGYEFGSGWGTQDLVATFSGSQLTLRPNSVNDASSYWYTPSGMPGATGNKVMDANLYVEDSGGTMAGQNITLKGIVLTNTLTTNANYTSVAFVKDFAPDFSSSVGATVTLTPGPFTVTLSTINDTNRHVQYGFETIGPDVWITDVTNNFGIVLLAPASSGPAAVSLTPAFAGGLRVLSFPTQSSYTYTVQYKTNLSSTNWSTLTTTNGTGSTAVVTDTNSPSRFYRLSVQ